jgi:hypothetical protein
MAHAAAQRKGKEVGVRTLGPDREKVGARFQANTVGWSAFGAKKKIGIGFRFMGKTNWATMKGGIDSCPQDEQSNRTKHIQASVRPETGSVGSNNWGMELLDVCIYISLTRTETVACFQALTPLTRFL